MPAINQLPTASTLSGSDNLPIYSAVNGDARKMSLTALVAYFQANFTSQTFVKNIQTPADGFNLTATQDGQWAWMLLRPTVPCATGTVVLPAPSVAADGQEFLITTTQPVTAFTLNGNGATALYGAPSVLGVDDKFKMKYDSQTTSWYAVV